MNEPKKRIKWKSQPHLATEDKTTLLEWVNGVITTERAIKKIIKTNELDSLDEETFIENAQWLGWRKPSKKLMEELENAEHSSTSWTID